MTIRRLPPDLINRIAAGEVVERPASAVKELVENALDAGAQRIEIQVEGGGLSRILVADDGDGMSAAELLLAVERHATSKLSPDGSGAYDLLRIATLGFRGEALPSIGSVARLSLTSRPRGVDEAHGLTVDAGRLEGPFPAPFPNPHGTRVEVRELFSATPARLKFMKSARSEDMAIAEAVRRQALAEAQVAFSLDLDGRKALRLPKAGDGPTGRLARIAAVLGGEFADNALELDQEREGLLKCVQRVKLAAGCMAANHGDRPGGGIGVVNESGRRQGGRAERLARRFGHMSPMVTQAIAGLIGHGRGLARAQPAQNKPDWQGIGEAFLDRRDHRGESPAP